MNAMRTATALCNARVLTPDGFVEDLAVLMQYGRIADLVADDAIPSEAVRHDLHGATLLPGFIDAQVNGGGGALFNNDTSVEAIRTIALGRRYLTPAVAELLAQQLNRKDDAPPHEQLSEREFQVFLKLAKGETAGDIAKALSLSVKTVSTYRTRLMEKMSLSSNSDLTYYALKNRLID